MKKVVLALACLVGCLAQMVAEHQEAGVEKSDPLQEHISRVKKLHKFSEWAGKVKIAGKEVVKLNFTESDFARYIGCVVNTPAKQRQEKFDFQISKAPAERSLADISGWVRLHGSPLAAQEALMRRVALLPALLPHYKKADKESKMNDIGDVCFYILSSAAPYKGIVVPDKPFVRTMLFARNNVYVGIIYHRGDRRYSVVELARLIDRKLVVSLGDGSGVAGARQLTSTGRDFDPLWSPDGRKIAFLSLRETYNPTVADRRLELWVMREDGSDQRPIVFHKDPDFAERVFNTVRDVSWFPDSQSLLCHVRSGRGEGLSEVWRVFLDGTRKTLTPAKEHAQDPRCSPDGRKIAYLIQGPNPPQGSPVFRLYVADAEGANGLCLAKGLISGFTWTSDGEGIIYTLYDRDNKNYDLWESLVDGARTRRITRTKVSEEQPHCSPDGKSILYGTSWDVYITPKDTFKPKKLISGAVHARWIPGGKLLSVVHRGALTLAQRSWTHLRVLDLKGNVLKKIGEGSAAAISFAPDGERYVYSLDGNLWVGCLDIAELVGAGGEAREVKP